jgi:hypothetical protein
MSVAYTHAIDRQPLDGKTRKLAQCYFLPSAKRGHGNIMRDEIRQPLRQYDLGCGCRMDIQVQSVLHLILSP